MQAKEVLKVTKENEALRVQIDHLKRKVTQLTKENETLKSVNQSKNPQQDILQQLLSRMNSMDTNLNVKKK